MFPLAQFYVATGYALLGLFDRAEEEFSRTLAMAPANGHEGLSVGLSRSMMLIDQRRLDEASALASWVAQEAELQGDQLMRLISRLHWVEAQLHKGLLEAAESEALLLVEVMAAEPYLGMGYLAVLAGIHLAGGRAAQAAEVAERALSQSRSSGMEFWCRHAMLLLVRAEALHALGDPDAACQAIREAAEDLRRRAMRIPDPEVRRSFLENFPDHRRTLELARQWRSGTS